jgi:hypothetical protein
MDISPSDLLFLVMVIWLAIQLIDGDWGGGLRSRVPSAVRL